MLAVSDSHYIVMVCARPFRCPAALARQITASASSILLRTGRSVPPLLAGSASEPQPLAPPEHREVRVTSAPSSLASRATAHRLLHWRQAPAKYFQPSLHPLPIRRSSQLATLSMLRRTVPPAACRQGCPNASCVEAIGQQCEHSRTAWRQSCKKIAWSKPILRRLERLTDISTKRYQLVLRAIDRDDHIAVAAELIGMAGDVVGDPIAPGSCISDHRSGAYAR